MKTGIGFFGGAPITLAFVDFASSPNASPLTVPAAAQAGDIGLWFDVAIECADGGALPSGHTSILLKSENSGQYVLRIAYKKLVGTEPGNTLQGTTDATGTQHNKKYVVFRPSRSISSIIPSTWLESRQVGDPNSQSVAASGQQSPVINLGMAYCSDNTNFGFSTFTGATSVKGSGVEKRLIVGYRILNTAPVTQNVDMADEGNQNWLASGYIRVT